MADTSRNDRSSGPTLSRLSISLLFLGSGCAALIYELVWFHLLRLVIGSSSISLGILLASFMGGMCLGSWALSRIVSEKYHPLRVYAVLEIAIGVFGATLPWWLPWLNRLYLEVASPSVADVTARAVVAGFAVLPATMLMGATLPAIARWVKSTPYGFSQLGAFYGANIFGGVIGCLLAGFVLLPWTDTVVASYVAAAINTLVAIVAWQLSRNAFYQPALDTNGRAEISISENRNATWVVNLVALLSGLSALSAEVVWTRLLALQFGSTVYTFAIILAVFLAGLGLGSVVAARLVGRTNQPILWLAIAQLAVVCLTPYANYLITRVLPYWPRPEVQSTSDVYWVFVHDAQRTLAAVLPSAFFWGASFPLALASAARGHLDTGRLVGQVYAANTLGAICGALMTSSVLIPSIGSHKTQQLIALVSGAAATIACAALILKPAVQTVPTNPRRANRTQYAIRTFAWPQSASLIALPIISILAAYSMAPPPHGFFGRSLYPQHWKSYDHIFEREGRTTTVVVLSNPLDPYRFISIGGKVEASNMPIDLRCQRLLGHLAPLIHPAPRKALTVGMGTASTAGCFVLHPSIEENVICEIEPVVRDAARAHFAVENHGVIDHERTRIHFDDARHYLSVTNETFDIITADPINSWIRGAAALYSAEYFALCKRRLNPGGIVVQWIPLYEKDPATAKCELATFLEAFPNATLWSSWAPSDDADLSHDIIAVGQLSPAPIDLAEIARRIDSNPRLRASLAEVNLATIPELMGQFAGYGQDLNKWLAGAEINRDRSLRLEYLAGLSLWQWQSHAIYSDILDHRRYPTELLVNDGPYEADIRERLKRDE